MSATPRNSWSHLHRIKMEPILALQRSDKDCSTQDKHISVFSTPNTSCCVYLIDHALYWTEPDSLQDRLNWHPTVWRTANFGSCTFSLFGSKSVQDPDLGTTNQWVQSRSRGIGASNKGWELFRRFVAISATCQGYTRSCDPDLEPPKPFQPQYPSLWNWVVCSTNFAGRKFLHFPVRFLFLFLAFVNCHFFRSPRATPIVKSATTQSLIHSPIELPAPKMKMIRYGDFPRGERERAILAVLLFEISLYSAPSGCKKPFILLAVQLYLLQLSGSI